MQTCYVYADEILCDDCGGDIVQTLVAECLEDDGDSCHFPQMELISESDTPEHCARCKTFLQNPLTHNGLAYVQTALESHEYGHGNREVLQQWARHYGFPYFLEWCKTN